MWSSRREAGACRLSSPAHDIMPADSVRVRGLFRQTSRPQERAGTVRGTERVISPAHHFGPLRGRAPFEGVARDATRLALRGRHSPFGKAVEMVCRQSGDHTEISGKFEEAGAPDWIRTSGLRLRRASLYPAELRVLPAYAVLTRKNMQSEDIKLILHKPLKSLQKNSFISLVQLLTSAFGGQRSIQLSYGCL